MKDYYLIRHAKTDSNKEMRFTGITDNGIAEESYALLGALVERFKNINIDKIYVSGLERTSITIGPLADSKQIKPIKLEGLNEMDFGSMEGLSLEEAEQIFTGVTKRMVTEGLEFRFPNGEKPEESYIRNNRAFDEIREMTEEYETVVICAHAGTIRNILSRVSADTYKSYWRFNVDNLSVSHIREGGGFMYIESVNEDVAGEPVSSLSFITDEEKKAIKESQESRQSSESTGAQSFMIVGTTSGCGKSTIATGLCRLFANEGIRVAPFKPQNMSLNSYITEDGAEIGRSQAVQAAACRIKPTADMNPILLKPDSSRKSQVIVRGKVVANKSAAEYKEYKIELRGDALESFNRLKDDYELIIMEGAGGALELNLRENDLSNMGMAELSDSPVILVGDIERGGIFGSVYGTLALMEESDRSRVKGIIVNKFRGDKRSFDEGVVLLERVCGLKVLGVVPYERFDIEEEDSISTREKKVFGENRINIAVVRLPYMSNYTDFMPLELRDDVSLIYTTDREEISSADLIIIPGTKSTMNDLKFLRESGLETIIKRAVRKNNTPIIGICGGFQILGEKIIDEENIEGESPVMDAMGLLEIYTRFSREKRTVRTEIELSAEKGIIGTNKKIQLKGYEIHMGHAIDKCGKMVLYCIDKEGNIFGTYLHGIFDNDEFTDNLLSNLKRMKGIEIFDGDTDNGTVDSYENHKDEELDRLADHLRDNLDIRALKDALGLNLEG